MRKPIIAGNWKMNKTVTESIDLANRIKRDVYNVEDVDIILCPPLPSLTEVSEIVQNSNIALGAQNVHWEEKGAFTGEVSCEMLKDAGCTYVIVGHSERRALFGETNGTVNKKAKAVLRHGLIPIVCVGETLEDRNRGTAFDVIKDHVENSLQGLLTDEMIATIVAYEPVWAIGTGVNATSAQAQEAHAYIRGLLGVIYGKDAADAVRIQYGGSVQPGNIGELIGAADVDGALVGGASLKAESFSEIIRRSSPAKINKG
ncbi:MAG: triose-phosphate isomerase [Candidatus Omnitrophota bacterium]